MAVAVLDVETATVLVPAPGATPVPQALRRMLPHLGEALRSTALPATTRLAAMSSYHLGWTDAQGRSRG